MKKVLFGILLMACSTAMAQSTHIKTLLGKDQISLADSARLYKTLLDNTPIEPEFTYEPHFAIVGTNGKFYFSTGARLRFTASFDWNNPVKNPTAMGVQDLEPSVAGNRSLFQMSAGSSELYFNIIGFPNTGNQVGLFISINLDSDNDNSYHLKAGQVYMRYRHIQCGYATSLYNDRAANNYSINGSRPCASGSHNAVQINYQRAVSKHVTLGIGIEKPDVSYTPALPAEAVGNTGDNVNQRIPDIPIYVNYGWGETNHVRLSAVLRNISYYNNVKDENNTVTGWGLKLTGSYSLHPLDFCYTVQGGHGIANYMVGTRDRMLDLVPYNDPERGELRATDSFGFIAGAQYNINPKVFVSGQFSWMRNFIPYYNSGAAKSFENHTRRALCMNVNAVWRISELFSAGLEYCYARKRTEGGEEVYNNRLFGMFMMNF